MPVSYSMTWEPGPRRWRKMYRGKVYTVSALDLGVTPTKDGSFRQANDWWTAKRAELDACPVKAPFSFAETELSRRLAWAREHEPKLAEELVLRIERLAGLKEGSAGDLIEALGLLTTPDLDQRIAAVEKLGIEIPGSLHPFLLDGIFGDEKSWPSRLAAPTSRVPEERTVAAQVAKYLGRLRERVRSGRPSVAEYDLIERYLGEFAAWLVGDSSVDSITVDKWEDWYYHILKLPCSVETKKKRYRYPRTFVEWLVEKDVIREPANLASRKFRFEGGSRKGTDPDRPRGQGFDRGRAGPVEAPPPLDGELRLHPDRHLRPPARSSGLVGRSHPTQAEQDRTARGCPRSRLQTMARHVRPAVEVWEPAGRPGAADPIRLALGA